MAEVNLVDEHLLDLVYIDTSCFWIAEKEPITEGEDVFLIGRFVNHDGGKKRNKQTLRYGNISTLDAYVKCPAVATHAKSILLDMRTRSGYSGSPVFINREPHGAFLSSACGFDGIALDDKALIGKWKGPYQFGWRLLGINWGVFNEEGTLLLKAMKMLKQMQSSVLEEIDPSVFKDLKEIRGWYQGAGIESEWSNNIALSNQDNIDTLNGTTIVCPVGAIIDILNLPTFQKKRGFKVPFAIDTNNNFVVT